MTQNTENIPSRGSRSDRGGDNPLIVQGDRTILVEVASPRYAEARDALVRFAELMKSPEHVHTYRITPLSIWNACAAGEKAEEIVEMLRSLSRSSAALQNRSSFGSRQAGIGNSRPLPSLERYWKGRHMRGRPGGAHPLTQR